MRHSCSVALATLAAPRFPAVNGDLAGLNPAFPCKPLIGIGFRCAAASDHESFHSYRERPVDNPGGRLVAPWADPAAAARGSIPPGVGTPSTLPDAGTAIVAATIEGASDPARRRSSLRLTGSEARTGPGEPPRSARRHAGRDRSASMKGAGRGMPRDLPMAWCGPRPIAAGKRHLEPERRPSEADVPIAKRSDGRPVGPLTGAPPRNPAGASETRILGCPPRWDKHGG